MKDHQAGEISETKTSLAGGIPARLVSKLLPGPALSVALTVPGTIPVYLTQRVEGRPRAMELRTANGICYWAEDYRTYVLTDTARGSLELRPLTHLEDALRPTHIVFTDDGSPSAVIIAGYLVSSTMHQAYESTGMRLRPTGNRTPENALVVLALAREAQFRRR